MTSKVNNVFSEAHFDMISRFCQDLVSSIWSCHMDVSILSLGQEESEAPRVSRFHIVKIVSTSFRNGRTFFADPRRPDVHLWIYVGCIESL